MLRSPQVAKVCHDSKRLLEVLGVAGEELAGDLDDTTLEAYLISSTTRGYDLASLSADLLERQTIPREQVLGRGSSGKVPDPFVRPCVRRSGCGVGRRSGGPG